MDEGVLHNVMASLDLMWRGMAGLFVVCGGIALIMSLVARCIKPKA
jgi:hypothetical protein